MSLMPLSKAWDKVENIKGGMKHGHIPRGFLYWNTEQQKQQQ